MGIIPLYDRVVVRQMEGSTQTEAGLHIPEGAVERPCQGEAIAVGPGRVVDGKVPMPQVRQGDRILFSKYAGTKVEFEGQEYLIIRFEDAIAKIE